MYVLRASALTMAILRPDSYNSPSAREDDDFFAGTLIGRASV